jgi:hypothetical protein
MIPARSLGGQGKMADVTGRDGMIMGEALAFAYSAMRYLPTLYRPESNRADMRALLFAGTSQADFILGEAMLTAWHLTHDTRTGGRDAAESRQNLSELRAEALLEMNAGTDQQDREDLAVMIRHVDRLLMARMG